MEAPERTIRSNPAANQAITAFSSYRKYFSPRINLLSPRPVKLSGYMLSDIASDDLRQPTSDSGSFSDTIRGNFPAFGSTSRAGLDPIHASLLLIQELEFLHMARARLSEHVLEYLASAELSERDPWIADDLRVAWLAVLYAGRDYPDPWGRAFWWYYGKTHAKALLIWQERERKTAEILGHALSAIPPKKPSQSVGRMPEKAKRVQ